MQSLNHINELLQRSNGVLLTSEAEKAGIPRKQLLKLVKDGILERTERGVYVKADGMEDVLYSLQKRAGKIVYSHETALFLHNLTDRNPFRYSITVPSGYKPSESIKSRCKIYYIKSDLLDLGKIELPSGFGHPVVVYDMERTICDIARSRSRIDTQVFTEALKNYSNRKEMDLNKLNIYARQFGIHNLLRQYLEVLL